MPPVNGRRWPKSVSSARHARKLPSIPRVTAARRGGATPGFVWDLAEREADHFETVVLVPRVGDVAEAVALRRLIAEFDPDVLRMHWVLPQGLVAALAAPGRRWVLTAHGGMSTPWRGGSPPASNGSRYAVRPPSRCRTRRCVSASSNSAPILAPRCSAPWAPT